jgi:hypothetical protein
MREDRVTKGRTVVRRLTFFVWSGVLLAVSLTFVDCRIWGNDVVKVKVMFSASSPGRQLTELTLVAGSDKYSWDTLPAGAVRSVNLLPGPRDDRQVLLSFALDGRMRYWAGPKFDIGTGYEIEVTVDATGNVTARHCLLPCSLS